jgi:hypothetical protein
MKPTLRIAEGNAGLRDACQQVAQTAALAVTGA